MDWLSHPWYRADPIALRRYLESISRPPQAHGSPKRIAVPSDDFYSMTHQSKKKRIDDDSLPPDAGSKPVQLQRRRVWRACESCRRKKIKCDGCEPTCAQCQASGSQCTWLQTKDRAALSRHYVQELEARLLHMESLFSQITPLLEQLGPSASLPPTTGPSTVPSDSTDEQQPISSMLQALSSKLATDAHTDSSSSPESSGIKMEDDVSESFGQLALDEHGHMRWIGGSSTISLIQSFRTLASSPLHRISPTEEDPRSSANKLYFPASVFFGKVHALPGADEVEYPAEELCEKLIEAYFERLHFLMPVLDKPSFMSRYKKLMAKRGDTAYIQAEAAFLSVVFAVFACSAKLVNDPRPSKEGQGEGGMGMVYYERALILHYISNASIQVFHVQSFILMSSFLCSINCLPRAWILVGQAVRTAQDLGLHRSPRRLAISATEKETRRKIWWSVYCLDRMLALALGRPLGIEDSDCDVELPVDVDDEYLQEFFSGVNVAQRQPSLMSGTIALVTLYQIAGRVLRQVYHIDNCKEVFEPEKRAELQRSVETLDLELAKWREEWPAPFKSGALADKHGCMTAVLCSHYYSVLMTLHRNFLPVRRDHLVAPKSVGKAVMSARSCLHLAPSTTNVIPPSHHFAFFIQHLFSSAVIILLYSMHCPDTRAAATAMDEVKSCLPAIESWEGLWPGARKCKELLTELTNTADDAIKRAHNEERSMAQNVAPAMLERRRSLVASPSAQVMTVGRPLKMKLRKVSRSRDATSTRRPPAVAPYRVDSQRNRSTSRKRGHDESEGLAGPSGGIAPYPGAFSSPQSVGGKSSPHSSPASVNLPSPSMPTAEAVQQQEGGPHLIGATSYSYPGAPMSPLHASSPYDYGMHHSPLATANAHQWDEPLYQPGSQCSSLPYATYEHQNMDAAWYGPSTDMGGYSRLSTTPPTSSFTAPGLPFIGLDYIRNYSTNGYCSPTGDQDSLWHTIDTRTFGFDPELPFTFMDASPELHEGPPQQTTSVSHP